MFAGNVGLDPVTMKNKKLPGGEEIQKHSSFSWHPFCVAGKDKGAQPSQEAKQEKWRGAHSQDGPHVHEC